MKLRSILAFSLLILAPLASAQTVDQLIVGAATQASTDTTEVTADKEVAHEAFAPAQVNTDSVARQLDIALQQRFDRNGDIPRPSESLLVGAN